MTFHGVIGTLVGILVAAAVVVGLVLVPKYQVRDLPELTPIERFAAENDARRTLTLIIGGLSLFLGLYLTARRIAATERSASAAWSSSETAQRALAASAASAQENLRISREDEITDRLNQAIVHLADERLAVRIGGIFALERIARDSARDHAAVFEVLTAFVREKARFDESTPEETKVLDGERIEVPRRIAADAQAILTVIGRRRLQHEGGLHEKNGEPFLDLSATHLSFADLRKGNFKGVSFQSARLDHATLEGANLEYADLSKARLEHAQASHIRAGGVSFHQANLEEADLEEANLNGASLDQAQLRQASLAGARLDGTDFTKADLREANLSGASLRGARLAEANVEGADLSDAVGLTKEQIDSATSDRTTILPEDYLEQESPDDPSTT